MVGASSRKQFTHYRHQALMALSVFLAGLCAVGKPAHAQSLTIQGRIINGSGVPVEGSATQFRVKLLTPDGRNCVLYDESRTLDLAGSHGLFSLNVGDGTGTINAPAAYSLDRAVSNQAPFTVNASFCASGGGGIYTPTVNDNRKVEISFYDPSSMPGWETIPEMDLNPVAYAMEGRTVGGFPSSSLLRVVTGGTPGNVPALSAAQAAELALLASGTSDKYMPVSTGTGARLPGFSTVPASSSAGSIWFENTGSGSIKYKDALGNVQTLGTSSAAGTITEVSGGVGLTGGGTSGSVSLSLSPSGVGAGGTVGSASSVPVLTYDTYGRITGASSAAISGISPAGSAGGDLGGTYPGPSVTGLQGKRVSGTAPVAGEFFRFSDKGTTSTADDEWTPAAIRGSDLKDSVSGALLPGACAGNETIRFNGMTGGYGCAPIADLASSQLADSATIPSGGSFRQVNVNSKGLVTGGSNPTTLAGYAISDAMENSHGVPKISAGSDVSMPAGAVSGELFVAENSNRIYRYNGSSWTVIASAAGAGGTLTDVLAGGGLTRSSSGSTVTLALPSIAAVTNAVKVSTDSYGRVISAGTLTASDIPALSWSKISSGLPSTLAGYGITDAVSNLGGANGIAVGTGAPPARSSATAHTFYLNSATAQLYYDDGSAWINIAQTAAGFSGSLSGDVTGAQGATSVERLKGVALSISGLAANQYLRYNGTGWTNSAVDAAHIGGGTLGASHLPAFSGDVSSAGGTSALTLNTVAVGKGGTGLTSLGLANQLLAVNSSASGMEYKTLTQGSGVTITHSAGDITISAVGSGGTVTSVGTGAGLTGGTITGAGTISLASISNNSVLANLSGSTAAPTPTTITSLVDALSNTRGSILYRGPAGWTGLSAGTAGQVLTTHGPSGDPSWENAAASGVTSINVSAPNMTSSGAVTSSGTIALSYVSQTAGFVLAAPKAASGVPSFRHLEKADLRSTTGGELLSVAGACSAGTMLNYNSGTDKFECSAYTLSAAQITSALGYTPVNKAGDTMTGPLSLPANGLAVGTNQLVVSAGNVSASGSVSAAGGISTSGTATAGSVVSLGGVKIGSLATACDASTEGTLRYNSSTKKMEFCDSVAWKNISSGVAASVAIGAPSVTPVKSGPVTYTVTYGSGTDTATIALNPGHISIGGSDPAGCSVSGVSGSGSTRTVTVSGCTGTGTVNISVAANTAQSTTGDPAAAAGPSTAFNADNTGPSTPGNLALGAVPPSLTATPVATYDASADTGGGSVASYQAQIERVSDNSVVQSWVNHVSGTAVAGLTLSPSTNYRFRIRATDSLGNSGASSAATWTTTNCPAGTIAFSYTGAPVVTALSGCSTITVKLWGAGGGGGQNAGGGAGGFTTRTFTGVSAANFTINVGGGGKSVRNGGTATQGYNGGGRGGTTVDTTRYSGGGGGATTFALDGTLQMAAAGGGGGSGWNNDGSGVQNVAASPFVTSAASWTATGFAGFNGYGEAAGGCNGGGGGGAGGGAGGSYECNNGSGSNPPYQGSGGRNLVPSGGTSSARNTTDPAFNGTAGAGGATAGSGADGYAVITLSP